MRLVAALLAAALIVAGGAPGERNAERAALAHWAMRHAFLDVRTGVYRETEGQPAPATAWP